MKYITVILFLIGATKCEVNRMEVKKDKSLGFDMTHFNVHNGSEVIITDENYNLTGEPFESHIWLDISFVPGAQYLPINIADLYPNVENIYADNCSIVKIWKKNFRNLSNLKKLYLSGNKIDTINGDTFDDLLSLEKLDLLQNSIHSLDEKTFKRLIKLKILILSDNKLTELPSKIFQNNFELRELYLSKNQLVSLPLKIFISLVKLEQIWLDGNYLTSLSVEHFFSNRKLRIISLKDNKISSLFSTILVNKEDMEEIDLRNNICIDEKYGSMTYYDPRGEFQKIKPKFVADVGEKCTISIDIVEIQVNSLS